jgi:hypothetical protein
MGYAVLVGLAPTIMAFIAGFLGVELGWPAYIAWFVLSIAVGAGVTVAKKRA